MDRPEEHAERWVNNPTKGGNPLFHGYYMRKELVDGVGTISDDTQPREMKDTESKETFINELIERKYRHKGKRRTYMCADLVQIYYEDSGKFSLPGTFHHELQQSDLVIDKGHEGFVLMKEVRSRQKAKENNLPWANFPYMYVALICTVPGHGYGARFMGNFRDVEGVNLYHGIVDKIALERKFKHVVLASVTAEIGFYTRRGYQQFDSVSMQVLTKHTRAVNRPRTSRSRPRPLKPGLDLLTPSQRRSRSRPKPPRRAPRLQERKGSTPRRRKRREGEKSPLAGRPFTRAEQKRNEEEGLQRVRARGR